MKIHLDDKVYEVEEEVLDYLTLHYGNQLLQVVDNLDSTLQFGMKLVTKAISKKLLESFGVSSKLPRGSDPTLYLVKAYIVLMRETLNVAHLHLEVDGQDTIVEGAVRYDNQDGFVERMGAYLENLKTYVGSNSTGALATAHESGDQPSPDSGRAGTELAAGGTETFGQDDGGQDHCPVVVPAFS